MQLSEKSLAMGLGVKILVGLVFLSFQSTLVAQTSGSASNTPIDIVYDEAPPDEDEANWAMTQIEDLLSTRLFVSGLNAGADAVNHSIDSLMDAVFYSLLDHEFVQGLTRDSWFSEGFGRRLFSTLHGGYIVVDQSVLGPRYSREVWRIGAIPIRLGVNASAELVEIYHRNDATRLAERSGLPWWRMAVNNWFGILPILSRILPPSFNPNEMYDPVRLAATPFSFPTSVESFKTMPIGSIRSYGLTGGIQLPFNTDGAIDHSVRQAVEKAIPARIQLPLTLFVGGNYRIHVLRKSDQIAWVGVSRTRELGQSIAALVGDTLFLLSKVVSEVPWAGVPVPFFPVDVSRTNVVRRRFDRVFKYDLTDPESAKAYLAAVKGDFTLSEVEMKSPEAAEKDAIGHFFSRKKVSVEESFDNINNLVVVRRGREMTQTRSEIEIVDDKGRAVLMEAAQENRQENWDLLVGPEEFTHRANASLRVDKQMIKRSRFSAPEPHYTLATVKNPRSISIRFQIRDRFTDTEEYHRYLKRVSALTHFEFAEAPVFPERSEDAVNERDWNQFFVPPHQEKSHHFVTATVLGRFGVDCQIQVTDDGIRDLVRTPKDKLWSAIAEAFGRDRALWGRADGRSWTKLSGLWVRWLVTSPLKLLGVYDQDANFIYEANKFVSGIAGLRDLTDPSAMMNQFSSLLESDHPELLTRALVSVLDKKKIGRKVTFSVSGISGLEPSMRARFEKLNKLRRDEQYDGGRASRNEAVEEVLGAFTPNRIGDPRAKPVISSVRLSTKSISDSETGLIGGDREIVLKIFSQPMPKQDQMHVYLRMEQYGRVNLGKFVLLEDVAILPVGRQSGGKALDQASVEVRLGGPNGTFSDFLLEQLLSLGGTFVISFSVSQDGLVWSEPKSATIDLEDGRLVRHD